MALGWTSIRETAPVVSSQIRKVLEAKDVLTVWGDGEQSRPFTYVSDEVTGMMLAVEKHPRQIPQHRNQ